MFIKHEIGFAHRVGVVDPLTSTSTFADSQESTVCTMMRTLSALMNEVLINIMLKGLGN